MKDFVIDRLRELYSAEIQMKIILEKMAFKTGNEALRHQLELISKQLESQFSKLEKAFSLLGKEVKERREIFCLNDVPIIRISTPSIAC